jgi:GMP synthase-like glutamine amidotransferase
MVPEQPGKAAGLILLGGGPYGIVSGHLLPSLGAELRLTRAFLDAGLPVLGFGLGAVILSVAAGGGAEEAPLRFAVELAFADGAGLLPDPFPLTLYLRDRPLPPPDAKVLARSGRGEVLAFATHGNSLGLLGHPGMKRGMAEDLIMEFAETPEDTLTGLHQLGQSQAAIAEVLGPLMVALTRLHGWM